MTESWIRDMEKQIEDREDLRIRLLFVSRHVRVIYFSSLSDLLGLAEIEDKGLPAKGLA